MENVLFYSIHRWDCPECGHVNDCDGVKARIEVECEMCKTKVTIQSE